MRTVKILAIVLAILCCLVVALLILFNIALYPKPDQAQSGMLATKLDRHILIRNQGDAVSAASSGPFCSSTQLADLTSGELYGVCQLFTISGVKGDCAFWWLGRMCLRLATTEEIYANGYVRGEFRRFVSEYCMRAPESPFDVHCNAVLFNRPATLDVYTVRSDRRMLEERVIIGAERIYLDRSLMEEAFLPVDKASD